MAGAGIGIALVAGQVMDGPALKDQLPQLQELPRTMMSAIVLRQMKIRSPKTSMNVGMVSPASTCALGASSRSVRWDAMGMQRLTVAEPAQGIWKTVTR